MGLVQIGQFQREEMNLLIQVMSLNSETVVSGDLEMEAIMLML